LISYPSGFLSDKWGRKTILLVSIIIFLITYLGFALTRNILLIAMLFILYGLYQGIFRSVGKAFATDFVPEHLRASGVGWYTTTVGISGLVASVIAGQLWDNVSHTAVFLYGVTFAIVGGLALLLLIPAKQNKPTV
jgi:MFS family permease